MSRRRSSFAGAFRHSLWFLFALGAYAGPSLVLRVSSETAAAGGSAQFKVFADSPALIASGTLAMDFDPKVFGPIGNVAVFSATGDAMGYANVSAEHVDVHFSSASASIGQLPGLPIFVVSVAILSGASGGAVTADPSASSWTNASKAAYSVSVVAGGLTVGAGESILNVTPGGGVLPAGSVVKVTGSGFLPADTVSIDGVSIATQEYVGSGEIDVTLGAPTEMTGKHVRVGNSDYFASLPSVAAPMPEGFTGLTGIVPLVPLATMSTGTLADNTIEQPFTSDGLALLNPNLTPVTVLLQGLEESVTPFPTVLEQSLTIPPSSLFFFNATQLVSTTAFEQLWIVSSAPIRMLEYIDNARPPTPTIGVGVPATATGPPPAVQAVVSGGPVNLTWQIGTPLPTAALTVQGQLFFNVAVSGSAVPFLTVTPQQGTAPQAITVTPTLGATPGTYTATITITPVLPAALSSLTVQATTIAVTLTVSTGSLISTTSSCCYFPEPNQNGPVVGSDPVVITSNGMPAAFTVTLPACASGNWLSVSPTSGVTPATLTFSANPVGLNLPGDVHSYPCPISVQGPANTLMLTATLQVIGGGVASIPPSPSLTTTPDYLTFQYSSPGAAPLPETLQVGSNGTPISATAQTQSGGNWLSISVAQGNPAVVTASVSSSLPPGSYIGMIAISASGYASISIYVEVTVLGVPASQVPLIVTPSPILMSGPAGSPAFAASADISIAAPGGIPVAFTISVSGGAAWLTTVGTTSGITPADAEIEAMTTLLAPGVYQGSVTVTWSNGSLVVPVILTVTASLGSPPTVAAIVNGASQAPTSVAPGEIISIFGTAIGSTQAGSQVLINGMTAPLIYASPNQLNAVVPYEVGSARIAAIQVQSFGALSAAWGVPVAASSPAIFTIAADGLGPGAVLNQDNSINSASKPAARGSAIQIYATGGGQTSPASYTGAVAGGAAGLTLPVTVTIGGASAQVLCAGSAPGEIDGVVQINAIVPTGIVTGGSVPVVVTIGGAASQAAVTMAVK